MTLSSKIPPVLIFISVNGSQPRSLSPRPWDLLLSPRMVPRLQTPDRLTPIIPDLQGYGRGPSVSNTLSLLGTASLLVDLIAKHAHNGKADIVGLSFGGFAVLLLAARYPRLVRRFFASGCHLSWEGTRKNWFMGLGLGLDIGLVRTVPTSWLIWLCSQTGMYISDDLYVDMCSSSFVRNGSRGAEMEVVHALRAFDMKTWETVGARALLVVRGHEPHAEEAGKRGGIVESCQSGDQGG